MCSFHLGAICSIFLPSLVFATVTIESFNSGICGGSYKDKQRDSICYQLGIKLYQDQLYSDPSTEIKWSCEEFNFELWSTRNEQTQYTNAKALLCYLGPQLRRCVTLSSTAGKFEQYYFRKLPDPMQLGCVPINDIEISV